MISFTRTVGTGFGLISAVHLFNFVFVSGFFHDASLEFDHSIPGFILGKFPFDKSSLLRRSVVNRLHNV